VLVPCLSNAKDKGGRTALVEYSNEGDYIATHWMPTRETAGVVGAEFADGYGYDARVLPRKNALLTTSFTGWKNYTREFGDLAKDSEAMKQFGGSMVLWDFHTRQPKKVFKVPGAPLEIRWAWGEKHNYAFTATALGSKLWLCYEDKNSEWQVKEVATIGGEGGVLPVDMSLSADDQTLFVDSFGDGKSACLTFRIRSSRNRFTRSQSASRSTWCRKAGMGSGSISAVHSWRDGTRAAMTMNSSSKPTDGMAKN